MLAVAGRRSSSPNTRCRSAPLTVPRSFDVGDLKPLDQISGRTAARQLLESIAAATPGRREAEQMLRQISDMP